MARSISNRDKRLVGSVVVLIFAVGLIYFVSKLLLPLIGVALLAAAVYYGYKFLSKKG